MQKLNFHKLRALHDVADKHEDSEMADFIGAHAEMLTGPGGITPTHDCAPGVPCHSKGYNVWVPSAEGELLEEQAQAVKDAADMVAQLRRVGKGLGVFQFDRELLEGGAAV